MYITGIKPIRPTTAMFSEEAAQKIDTYATQISQTKSVGMDRMREMMREFTQR